MKGLIGTMSSSQDRLWRCLKNLFLLCSILALLLGMAGPLAGTAFAQSPAGRHALVISVDGVINPVKKRFIGRAIDEAQESGAVILIIRLDTPGGLLNSTRDIVELLLGSPVPTAVYVSPSGARAGSAGTFLTAAANFAVMTPGSNIGAATPVSGPVRTWTRPWPARLKMTQPPSSAVSPRSGGATPSCWRKRSARLPPIAPGRRWTATSWTSSRRTSPAFYRKPTVDG